MDTKAKQTQINSTFDSWCDIYGNQKKLADYCGVSAQAVGQWRRKIPAVRVLQIESCTCNEVSRHDLRPDLYPIEVSAV